MPVPLEQLTLWELIEHTAWRFPKRTALARRGAAITYGQLARRTELVAAGLLSMGVQKGDHVAIWADMSFETIVAFYAIQRIGAVAFPLHTGLPPQGALSVLGRGDAAWLIQGDGLRLPEGQEAEARTVIAADASGPAGAVTLGQVEELGRGCPSERLTAAQKGVVPGDPAVMLMTSGTTGTPKLVITSHFSRINSGIQQARDMGAGEGDIFLAALPMYHCFCLSAVLYAALAVGACVYLPESRHSRDLVAALREGGCTILHAVPTQFLALVESPLLQAGDAAPLRVGIIGGGGCAPKLFRRIEKALGLTLLSSLGMTEATAGVTVSGLDDDITLRSTTVGRFMRHLEGKIVDIKTGRELPAGAAGEILIRGYGVMLGYYKDPALTAQRIDPEGWLHSGDIGYLDEQGNLHLEGRIKELIIRGGENISPMEVEAAILEMDGVRACKVVGVPDPYFGEEVCAVVVCDHETGARASEIRLRLAPHLEPFKIPKYVLFVDALPLNDLGKIDLRTVQRIATEYAESIGAHETDPREVCPLPHSG